MLLIEELRALLGPDAVLTAAQDLAGHVEDWRGRYLGQAACVVLPSTTEQVAAVVRATLRSQPLFGTYVTEAELMALNGGQSGQSGQGQEQEQGQGQGQGWRVISPRKKDILRAMANIASIHSPLGSNSLCKVRTI